MQITDKHIEDMIFKCFEHQKQTLLRACVTERRVSGCVHSAGRKARRRSPNHSLVSSKGG